MAFDANRDIKIEASETASGAYVLRTRGLADKRRPELEIAGVPAVALNAAGGVINMLADYTVNKAEVLGGQSVGNVLAVGDEGEKLLLVVRAVSAEKPKGGLWSKIAGGGKGVLRLVDPTGEDTGAPLTALATMLVHRAAVRLAKDDDEGAREELLAAIATLPGEEGAGKAPSIGGASGVFNWQNHLAYLELAKLAGDDLDEAAARFREALARSEELARRELGDVATSAASFAKLAEVDDEASVAAQAKRIIEHNLTAPHRAPGPTPALVTIASPVWERADDGALARRASLVPAALVELYYEGAAAERLARDGASLVAKVLGGEETNAWRALWVARQTRTIWVSEEAPLEGPIDAAQPGDALVSIVLADVARCYRAGASNEEIVSRYAGATAENLPEKLIALERWEGEQYVKAMDG